MKIKITELKVLVNKALTKYGYTEEESKIISEVLMYAQLRGNNQGIVKLIGKGIPKDPTAGDIKTIKETKLSTLLDGSHNQGMVVMKKAVEIVTTKAKEHGFGIVGINNTATSTGAIGYFARQIAKENLVGFVMAGSPPTVNFHGSYEAIFGTNPIAIGIPTDGEPIVLDMATSTMAYFGLIEAKTAGRSIPEGIAYDSEGNLTTDPAQAMDGAIRPFDKSYKGASLSLMVDILTGPLIAASYVGISPEKGWGNLIYAIDPSMLVDIKDFNVQVTELAAKVKATKKMPDVEEIFMPGEKGDRLTNQHLDNGDIEVEDNLLSELKKVAEQQ
ncbi:Ldh family oxidoreductase [Candidatus Shapirobacteria bacterium]|nr:Ldh family oxidoreductase [Candidatus Shapirobacteria bacterium]